MNIGKVGLASLFAAVSFVLLFSQSAFSQIPKIVTETFMVPARDSGIKLYVRNKHPEGIATFGSDRIVLFVHGGTYNAESSFDLPLKGLSWMDFLAQRGWDAYIMDVRGYGRSTRPPEMSQPPNENPPIVNTDVAVKDVSAVVDHVLAKRGASKINLIGWSWGATIVGAYAAGNNAKVERLALYAPPWLVRPRGGQSPLGAYRTVTREEAKAHIWRMPDEWFDAWWAAAIGPDPVGAGQNPPVVCAPNGVIEDLRKYWMSGRPYYDPAKITVPTLVIFGELDVDTPSSMALDVFAGLKNAPIKTIGHRRRRDALDADGEEPPSTLP